MNSRGAPDAKRHDLRLWRVTALPDHPRGVKTGDKGRLKAIPNLSLYGCNICTRIRISHEETESQSKKKVTPEFRKLPSFFWRQADGKLSALHRRWLNWYFRHRFPQAHFGRNLKLFGTPLLSFDRSANVRIGHNCVLVSKTKYNWAGLAKECSVRVEAHAELIIGDNSGFSGVSLYCAKRIVIGRNVCCGANASIWDTDFHPLTPAARRSHDVAAIRTRPIEIGDDVLIGAWTIVLKGVSIGDNAVIGAGSVVTKSIPNGQVWAGNPAKFVRDATGV
jgi:acetyltransferase-like isoleucine patch superfamily enzyme